MPDKYIVNMTEKTAPDDTNLLVIEDAVDTKKITFANLVKSIKDLIGNLASLTTSHKSTLVGAVNEVKADNDLRHPFVIYDTSTTLVDNAIKNAWASFSVGDSEQLVVFAVIRVAGSNSGMATIVKNPNDSGKVLLIKTTGSTTAVSLMNYDGSTWT